MYIDPFVGSRGRDDQIKRRITITANNIATNTGTKGPVINYEWGGPGVWSE